MPTFECRSCRQLLEVDSAPAHAVIACPTCGAALQPADDGRAGSGGVLQSALDELIERPGVRAFCSGMSSIVVHVGLGCLIFLIAAAVSARDADIEKPPEINVAIAATDEFSDSTGYRFTSKTPSTSKEDAQQTKAMRVEKPVGDPLNADATALAPNPANLTGASAKGQHSSIGESVNPSNLDGVIGLGAGAGGPGGRVGGEGGSGWGNSNRGPCGPFGVGDGLPGAKKIVYVVDRSGSMDQLGDFVRTELSRAANKLVSSQRFNVIWFSEGDVYKLATNLVSASEDNKSRLMRHLADVQFRGSTDPRGALFEAIAMQPDVIYILTDGNFDSDFVDAITKKNAGKVRINAIGFVLPSSEGHSNLIKLTRDNRGVFKAIDAAKLTGTI